MPSRDNASPATGPLTPDNGDDGGDQSDRWPAPSANWLAMAWLISVGAAIMVMAITASLLTVSALVQLMPKLDHGALAVIGMAALQVVVVGLTLAAARAKGPLADSLAWRRPAGGPGRYGLVVLAFLAFVVVSTVIATQVFPEQFSSDLQTFKPLLNSSLWPMAVVVVVIGAPLSEELLFRGLLLNGLARLGAPFWPAAIVTSGLWTVLHMGYSLPGLIEVLLAGVMLSWTMRLFATVIIPVLAHGLYNLIALSILFTLVT